LFDSTVAGYYLLMSLDRKRDLLAGTKAPASALDYEIAQEMASALGRLGRALEAALAALSDFDAAHRDMAKAESVLRAQRRALVAEAGTALWHFVVQREACGLRDTRQIMLDYRVPPEVRDRVGAFVPQVRRPRPSAG
jgi:hypothetical protein